MEFADTLTTLLPAEEAKKLRAELSELGVRVVRIGTLFERMSYDKDVVAIEFEYSKDFMGIYDDAIGAMTLQDRFLFSKK